LQEKTAGTTGADTQHYTPSELLFHCFSPPGTFQFPQWAEMSRSPFWEKGRIGRHRLEMQFPAAPAVVKPGASSLTTKNQFTTICHLFQRRNA
jgi:hypothetical protein